MHSKRSKKAVRRKISKIQPKRKENIKDNIQKYPKKTKISLINRICLLCKKKSELQKSHFIPNFVSKWIKKTAITGFMRSLDGRRQQDLRKDYLLCSNCEQILSNFESYFSKYYFYPLNESKQIEITEYDEKLLKFIVSISWRLYNWDKAAIKKDLGSIPKYLINITNKWRKYLLEGKSSDIGSHYLLFWNDSLYSAIKDQLGPKSYYYIFRGSDGTVTADNELIKYVFCQIPSFSIISIINPSKSEGFLSIEIKNKGKLNLEPVLTDDLSLINFISSRIKLIEQTKLSDRDIIRIKNSTKKN